MSLYGFDPQKAMDDAKKRAENELELDMLRELKKAVQELVSIYARPSIEPHKVTETWRRIKELADC